MSFKYIRYAAFAAWLLFALAIAYQRSPRPARGSRPQLPSLFRSSVPSLVTTWFCSAASPTPSGAGPTLVTPSACRSATNTATGTAGPDRRWVVRIQPPAPGGPYTLTITGHKTVELHNVLVGDVWLCGGQSNMGLPLRFTKNADDDNEGVSQDCVWRNTEIGQ